MRIKTTEVAVLPCGGRVEIIARQQSRVLSPRLAASNSTVDVGFLVQNDIQQ